MSDGTWTRELHDPGFAVLRIDRNDAHRVEEWFRAGEDAIHCAQNFNGMNNGYVYRAVKTTLMGTFESITDDSLHWPTPILPL